MPVVGYSLSTIDVIDLFGSACALAITVIAFLLPGWSLARMLHAPRPWLAAFVLSEVTLFGVVMTAHWCGLPVRFDVVLIGLLLVAALAGLTNRVWPAPTDGPPSESHTSRAHTSRAHTSRAWWGAFGVLVAAFAARYAMQPLNGYDTLFRWDALARRILEHQSLAFYPPTTAEDYTTYYYPDGIPPVVSLNYWWLYAMRGQPDAAWTGIAVTAQFACLLVTAQALAARVTEMTRADSSRLADEGESAGVAATLMLAVTPVFLWGVLMGQDTGLTALSVGAMNYYLIAEGPPSAWRRGVIAGCAAALGALTREYGCAFWIIGLAVMAWHRAARPALWPFLITTAAIGAPWYLRTWALSGNPFLTLDVFGMFSVNRIYHGFLNYWHSMFALTNLPRGELLGHVIMLARDLGLTLMIGVPAAICLRRRAGFLAVAALLVFLLFLQSLGYTWSGAHYAERTLTPMALVLAVAAACWLAPRIASASKPIRLAALSLTLVVSLAIFATIRLTPGSLPLNQRYLASRITWRAPEWAVAKALAKRLPPGTRVLFTSAYLAEHLRARGVEAIPIWSPEVAFLYDPSLSGKAIRQRLRERRITIIVYPPWLDQVDPIAGSAFARDRVNWRQLAETGVLADVYFLPP